MADEIGERLVRLEVRDEAREKEITGMASRDQDGAPTGVVEPQA